MNENHKNILVAEDNPSTRKLIKLILEKAGYNVSEASNGEEAIDIYNELGDIDLVITDIYAQKNWIGASSRNKRRK